MSDPLFKEGREFRDDDGNLICRAARDIYHGDAVTAGQFKDWQVPEPIVGKPIPAAIAKVILR